MLHISTDELRAIANQLRSTADEVQVAQQRVSNLMQHLEGAWTTAPGLVRDFDTSRPDEYVTRLREVAGLLDQLAAANESADANIAAAFER